MDSYMAGFGKGFMVSRNFRQANLQEVGLMQILGDYNFFKYYSNLTNFKIDSNIDKHHQVILSN